MSIASRGGFGSIATNEEIVVGKTSWILFFFSYVVCVHLHAQMIEVPLESLAEQNFNKKVISTNRIKSIKATYSSKADNSVVIDQGLTKGFEFDTLGNLTRFYLAQSKKLETKTIVTDTIATTFFYDVTGNVIGKRANAGVFFDTYYYEYFNKGKIKKETHCRETNTNLTSNEFKLGVQLILSQETFQYDSLTNKQYKKRCLNDEGREYKLGIINTDSSGKILNENYSFVVGWIKITNEYKYNKHGQLLEKIFWTNANGDVKEHVVYEYDTAGNLTLEKKYKNEQQLQEMAYLYDDKSLLKNLVIRYFLENRIGIVKYSYTLY